MNNQQGILEQLKNAPKLQLRGIYFAGPALSLMISALCGIITWGQDWDKVHQGEQLRALTFTCWGLTGILALVVISLSAGLIRSLNLSVGALKATVNLDDDSPPPKDSPTGSDAQNAPGS